MHWRCKAALQCVLAGLPGGQRLNYALQLLRGSHAAALVHRRLLQVADSLAWLQEAGVVIHDAEVVEIGTGWDAINAVLLYVLGARSVHTYDIASLLRAERLRQVLALLESASDDVGERTKTPGAVIRRRLRLLQQETDPIRSLAAVGIHYHAPADAAATGLAPRSVDLVYSYEVLEHVPPEILRKLHAESARIVRPSGHVYHKIDHFDHFAKCDPRISTVHFLGIPEGRWRLYAGNRLAYHNRMREPEFLDSYASAGLDLVRRRRDLDARAVHALRGMQLVTRFRRFAPQELAVASSEHLLRTPAA